MDRDWIATILNMGFRSFQNSMSEKVAIDIEQLFERNEDIKRNTKGLVLILFRLKQVYENQFNDFIDAWVDNPSTTSLKEAQFAEASTAFIPKLLVAETIEQMNKDYAFEEIYEQDMYYPELLLYLEEEQSKSVPKGYFFKFTEPALGKLPAKNVYVFVDEDDVTYGDVCEIASLRLHTKNYFECELVPLGHLPQEGEVFVYVRMSDVPIIELN